MQKDYYFVSYSRKDVQRVLKIVDKLQQNGIEVWIDSQNLSVGSSWKSEIAKGLNQSNGIIVFFSEFSLQSAWVLEEIESALKQGINIFPILIQGISYNDIPSRLAHIQFLDMRDPSLDVQSIQRLVKALKQRNRGAEISPTIATEFANLQIKSTLRQEETNEDMRPPDSVFVVHGHDKTLLIEVKDYLKALNIRPIVLIDEYGAEQSLFKKFLTWSSDTKFAIVLITADDVGAGRYQYDEPDIKDRSLQFRARQNVILELGYFYGLLGWDKVFVLLKNPDKKFPNFERPSDLDGVIFDTVESSGNWKAILKDKLKKSGFKV
jgi:predicted nucleotide-binding protein